MNYDEIFEAIKQGKNVYWINQAYKVFLDNNDLYTIFERNSYMCRLQPSEYKDCFIGVNHAQD